MIDIITPVLLTYYLYLNYNINRPSLSIMAQRGKFSHLNKFILILVIIVSTYAFSKRIYISNLAFCLSIISIIDVEKRIIPNKLLLLALILFLPNVKITYNLSGFNLIISAISLVFVLFLFLISIYDKGIGMGDVKFLFFTLVLLGPHKFIQSTIIMCFLTILTSIVLVITIKNKKANFPLGPIISISSLLVLIGG